MRNNLDMELTELAIANLSKDDDRYQEKLATLQDAGFWYDPVYDCWVKPEPLLEGERVRLQYFGSEGITSIVTIQAVLERCCSS